MDEHELLIRLKNRIGPDLDPVRPFLAPGKRAALLLAIWIVLGVSVLAMTGPRPDIATLGPTRSVGFSLVEVTLSFMLALVSFRFAVPALSGSRWNAVAFVVAALCLHFAISWSTLERSNLSPGYGEELRDGLSCAAAIAALGLAPMVLGVVLLRRGLLTRWFLPLVTTGFACGLAAEAAWRLRCPYSAWDHVLPFHSGALLLFTLVAAVLALLVRRAREDRR